MELKIILRCEISQTQEHKNCNTYTYIECKIIYIIEIEDRIVDTTGWREKERNCLTGTKLKLNSCGK